MRGFWRLHAYPCVDGNATVRAGEDRVEVELGDLREVRSQAPEPQHEVGERLVVGGRGTAEPGDEPARLRTVDEVERVAIGERREPEAGLADQLGERAAGAEGDERP